MQITRIEMERFMVHDCSVVDLPESGLVLVTGINGSGKSSFIEAVGQCGWGKPVRGTPGWRQGETTKLRIVTSLVDISRSRKGSRSQLQWEPIGPDSKSTEYDTTTKSQQALDTLIGSFNVWRRACVFSSADAAHFTMASDGDRKRLLESILGLEKFDDALDACRADLKKAKQVLASAQHEMEIVSTQLTALTHQHNDTTSILASNSTQDCTPKELRGKIREISKAIEASDAELDDLHIEMRGKTEMGAEEKGALRENTRRLAGIRDHAQCPTCGQTIGKELIDGLAKQVKNLREKIELVVEEVRGEMRALEDQQTDIEGEIGTLRRRSADLNQQVGAVEAAARQHEQAGTVLASIEEKTETLTKELDGLLDEIAEKKTEVDELSAVEQVLGLKGVRAHVLASSLNGIQVVANSWLAKIAKPGLRLELKPYSEKKSGGQSDAISLEISGAGGGYGYKGASGGERRRIDVALLLALAEVARAAQGASKSTLFFDEVFDALDADGIDAVTEALRELAQDRCVVVISHNTDLASQLSPVRHLRVGSGGIH